MVEFAELVAVIVMASGGVIALVLIIATLGTLLERLVRHVEAGQCSFLLRLVTFRLLWEQLERAWLCKRM
jgi:hypothetical protein